MVQNRIYDFGALLTQARTKTLATSLFTPGIYGGMDPVIVSGTQLDLLPGTYLLPNGVLVGEDANTSITVPTPAGPENYTVTVDHDDIQATGGSSAFYTLRSGILGREGDPNPNSLALLWIRHPGGGPLTANMLSRPPTLQAGTLLSAIEDGFRPAPFPNATDVVKGANITATQQSRSVRTGTGATLGVPAAGTITVTGLADMTVDDVGRFLRITNATGANNDWFQITAFNSATSVDITDNGTAPGSEGGVNYDVREPEQLGLQLVNTAATGLQRYQFRLPLPPRPKPRSIEVYASLASLATISFSTHPYKTYAADRTEVTLTPSSIAGPAVALDPGSSPVGTFTVGNYDEDNPPISLGVTIDVPAATPGVFIRGFTLVGD